MKRVQIILGGLFYCVCFNSFGYSAELKQPDLLQRQDTNFVIVSAAYNNKDWYQKSLDSIFSQTFPWRLILIDDASSDGTSDLVERYVQLHNMQDRVTLIKNKIRRDKLANVYNAIHSCKPNDVIVMLDADDWFYDSSVLEYLNTVYQDPAIWITYGQCVSWPINEGETHELPHHVIAQNTVRQYPFVTSHLKTFYAGLFQKIKREDLMWNGIFIPLIDDVAFMMAMLEMAGEHSRFISKLLCVVNVKSSQVHRERHRKDGIADIFSAVESYVRQQKPYARIECPF